MSQKGVTLLETILVLSLIALILIGGLNLYKTAKSSSDANQAMRQIQGVISGIRSIYSNSNNYEGLIIFYAPIVMPTQKALVASGVIPSDMIKNGYDIVNLYGARLRAFPTGNNTLIEFAYPGVPKDVCYKIVTQDIGAIIVSSLTSCVTGLAMNLPDAFDDTSCPAAPLNLSQAKNLCENLNAQEEIIFTFK